jgi:hypothetical protein
MSEKNILTSEYENLSDVQKRFYFSKEEEIESRFFYKTRKISWYTNIQLPLLMQKEGNYYVYIADNNFHLLKTTSLVWRIPAVSVKEEYRSKVQICWVKNLGISMIREAGLYIGDKKIQNLDSFCYCIHHKYLMKDVEKRILLSKMMGNVKKLTQWNTSIEQRYIILNQPWFYSKSEVSAFPLLLLDKKRIKHKYLFRDRIQDLLRMRVLTSEQPATWKELTDVNLSYLDIEQDIISPPEMLGNYALLSEEEYEFRKTEKMSYYINDFIKLTEETPKKSNEFVSLDINISEPTQCIFFVSENLSFKKGYTEFHDRETSKSPFSTVKLMYGTEEKIPEKEVKVLDYLESFYNFSLLSETIYKGLHVISFCNDIYSIDADTSICFKNLSAKIILKLRDNIQDIFRVRFYFYILKRLDIEREEQNRKDSVINNKPLNI